MLFESVWTKKGKTFVREYNPDTNKSQKRETHYKSEYYLPDPLGEYKGLLDNKPLRKVQGSAYGVENAYGEKNAKYVCLRDEYFDKDKYNLSPNVWFLDIETSVGTNSEGFPEPTEALEPIVLIQFFDEKTKTGYVLGLEDWYYKDDPEYKTDFKLVYKQYETEHDLINGFINLFETLDPLIIYAWNGSGFDFPYIFNRFKNLGINTNKLSNYGNSYLRTKELNSKTVHDVISEGHYWIDLMDVYKHFVFKNVPDYSLDTIGEIEAGVKKVSHDNYLKFDDFRTGKYYIHNNETEEQKQKKIHRCAVALEQNPNHPQANKLKEYIKKKSYSDFVWYGVQDFVVLKGIHDAQNFTSLMTSMASRMGCTIEDTLGTLVAWDKYITNTLYKDKKIAPPKNITDETPNVTGGFVRDPIVGKHKWILSVDVNSMYPLLGMASFGMSPESYIPMEKRPQELQEITKLLLTQNEEKIINLPEETWNKIIQTAKRYNVSLAVGGATFDKNIDGVVPKLVTEIYKGRKQAKKEMKYWEDVELSLRKENKTNTPEYLHAVEMINLKNTEQMTAKIQINSLYGATAAKYFSLYNENIAQAITGNGRFFIRTLANNIERHLQKLIPQQKPYVIYGDTDSVYFHVEPFVEKYVKDKDILTQTKWVNNFHTKIIEKIVQQTIDELANKFNAKNPEWIGASREVIADSGIFVAKKKYTLRVRDNEGQVYPIDDPYIKVQGLEIIKGGTPNFSKKYLKEAVPVLLDKNEKEIIKWFKTIKNDFLNWNLSDIAKTQGVSKIEDPNWGKIINGRKVSVPFGSRVAVVTNNYIKKHKLEETFNLIQPNDKVKILFLQEPNPLQSEAFAFTDVNFANKFKEYIDYDTTFDKFFVAPLKLMLNAIDVNIENKTEELDVW